MTEKEVLQLLSEVGAIISDSHFIYKSGRHGSTYINKDAIYSRTKKISRLCLAIAEEFIDADIEVVIGPEKGGILLANWTAEHLTDLTKREVLAVYAEKAGPDSFSIKRGYNQFISGKKVLVVEDILTTGGSVKKVVEATRKIGGEVIALAALCNRGDVTPQKVADVPKLFTLLNFKLDTWKKDECPLCTKGVKINTEFGIGKEFVAGQIS